MYIKRFVKHYYIMLVPAFLWLLFFSIVPMFGIVMAFQDYNPGQGILHSKFVGLANFEYHPPLYEAHGRRKIQQGCQYRGTYHAVSPSW